jgi:hypothetical protein
MLNLFRETNQTASKPPATVPVGKAAQLREELIAASASADKVAASIASAQQDLVEARAKFDRDTHAFALGKLRSEPSATQLHDAIARVDALRRSHAVAVDLLARLQPEVSAAELAERSNAQRQDLEQMIRVAESKLAEFEAAVATARRIESDLFDALFDRETGLRQAFVTQEIQSEADKARRRLRDRVVALAQTSRHAVHPRFSTDGDVYLGPDLHHLRTDADALRRGA